MNKKRLVLIDAYALIFRAYFALPPLSDKKGRPTNAVYGFVSALLSAIKDLKPDYLAVGIDMGKSKHHLEYAEYKAHRPPAPDDLKSQVPIVFEVCQAMNVPIIGINGYEGEDILATIVAQVKSEKLKSHKEDSENGQLTTENIEIILVTGDMDLLQLINDNVLVYSMARGTSQAVLYDKIKVKERYGIDSEQFVDYKALKGDASDNIPGVPGIGDKTSSNLIQQFVSLDKLYDRIADELERESLITKTEFLKTKEKIKQLQEDKIGIEDIFDVDVEEPVLSSSTLDMRRKTEDDSDSLLSSSPLGMRRKTEDDSDSLLSSSPLGKSRKTEGRSDIGDQKTPPFNAEKLNNIAATPLSSQTGSEALPIWDPEKLKNIAKNLNISQKMLTLLIQYKDQAFLSQKLSKICDTAPITFDLESAHVHDYDLHETVELFKDLGFKSLIPRLPHAESIFDKTQKKQKEEKDKKQQSLF